MTDAAPFPPDQPPQPEPTPEEQLAHMTSVMQGWVTAADNARVVGVPPPDANPTLVHARLVLTRTRVDTVEDLLAQATAFAGGAQRRATALKETADLAWARACQEAKKRPVKVGGDFEGARERYVEYDLATLEQRTAANSAQRFADRAAEARDIIKLRHRGLDSLRWELMRRLEHLTWESNNDR